MSELDEFQKYPPEYDSSYVSRMRLTREHNAAIQRDDNEHCEVSPRFEHLWSAKDKNGFEECLWCHKKRK